MKQTKMFKMSSDEIAQKASLIVELTQAIEGLETDKKAISDSIKEAKERLHSTIAELSEASE